jgi:hypothetical protein
MMALVCSVVLSATSYSAGHTPAPKASVVCYNNGASSIVVTGVQLHKRIFGSDTPGGPVPMGSALPPYGPGAPVAVAAGGTQTVGPFSVTVGSVASAIGGNSQPSQPADCILVIGATVFSSDGSRAEAGEAGMLVSYSIRPRINTQGGQLIFSQPSNSAGWFF